MGRNEGFKIAVRELSRKTDPEIVTRKLTRGADMTWDEATDLIKEVQKHHQGAIAREKAPLSLVISLLLLVPGLYLMFINAAVGVRAFSRLTNQAFEVAWLPLYDALATIDLPYGVPYQGTNMIEFYGGLALVAIAVVRMLMTLVSIMRP